MTTPNKTLLECLAIELGTHMINYQIASLEIEELTKNKVDSNDLIDALKVRILNLEADKKELRCEVIASRDKLILIEENKKTVVSKKK